MIILTLTTLTNSTHKTNFNMVVLLKPVNLLINLQSRTIITYQNKIIKLEFEAKKTRTKAATETFPKN